MGKPNTNRSIQREPPKLCCLNICFRETVRNVPADGRISGAIKSPHFCWAKEQLGIIDSRAEICAPQNLTSSTGGISIGKADAAFNSRGSGASADKGKGSFNANRMCSSKGEQKSMGS